MEAWTDLYLEVAERIQTKLPDIVWIDLWHEQISYLTEELPFPAPAVFIGFSTNRCDDMGLLTQECDTQMDLYLFYETFSDTYAGSLNQDSALEFLRMLTKLHTCFHGVSGENFQTMRRVDQRREDSGDAGNLYRISFNFNIIDASAQAEFDKNEVSDIVLSREDIVKPDTTDEEPLFFLTTQ